jgi:3-oxoacyl-[acyl-carrier protein] reductase
MAGGRLAGKVALITGAGRGFGRAIAQAFAREGARVAANYLGSRAGAEAVVAEAERLGAEAVALRGDVAREDDEGAGSGDPALTPDPVNNAGIMVRPMLAVPARRLRMFDVNVTGTMLRHALPAMIERRAAASSTSSQLAQRPLGGGGFAAYAATKCHEATAPRRRGGRTDHPTRLRPAASRPT